jgi:hypothetical protein
VAGLNLSQTEAHRHAHSQAQGQQAVQHPSTAFTALQTHPHVSAAEPTINLAHPCSEVATWTHAMLQAALMHAAACPSPCGGMTLPGAGHGVQPQPACSSSMPTVGDAVGWRPPSTSMQSLVEMVGAQIDSQVHQATAAVLTSEGLKASQKVPVSIAEMKP